MTSIIITHTRTLLFEAAWVLKHLEKNESTRIQLAICFLFIAKMSTATTTMEW